MQERFAALRSLVRTLGECRDYPSLRARLMDGLGSVMPSRAWGIYRLDEDLLPIDIAAQNVSDAFLLRYEELGRREDPLWAELAASHGPCHNLVVMSPAEWHSHPMFIHIASRLGGLDHILEAPLLGEGRIIGTLNFGRCHHDEPFGAEELALASALAHHVSTVLAGLRASPHEAFGLTPRELEIANLVAAGLNNGEIANCLTISRNTVKEALKRVFRKVEVDARAELAARLARGQGGGMATGRPPSGGRRGARTEIWRQPPASGGRKEAPSARHRSQPPTDGSSPS